MKVQLIPNQITRNIVIICLVEIVRSIHFDIRIKSKQNQKLYKFDNWSKKTKRKLIEITSSLISNILLNQRTVKSSNICFNPKSEHHICLHGLSARLTQSPCLKQSTRWSIVNPAACMKECTITGPTNRNPRLIISLLIISALGDLSGTFLEYLNLLMIGL